VIRKFFRGLAAAILTLAVTAGLVEIGARLWLGRVASETQFKRYASLTEFRDRFERKGEAILPYVPHRYLGYALSPGHRGLVVHHNALGFRAEDFPQKKPKGEFRILCLGSSTTYSMYPSKGDMAAAGQLSADPNPIVIAALEEKTREAGMDSLEDYARNSSYPGLLQKYFHQLGYTSVRVINAGVPGYTSYESLLNFELRCLELDPDVVLIYEGYNDIHTRLVWPHKAYVGDNSGANVHSSGWYKPLPWRLRSVALRIFLITIGRDRSPVDLAITFGATPKTAVYFAYQNEVLSGRFPSKFFQNHPLSELLKSNPPIYYRRNIENIVAVARAHGIVPVLMTFTSRPEGTGTDVFDIPEYRAALAEHNQVLIDIGKEQGVAVFDFAPLFPRDPELFSDMIHMTFPGGRAMAKLVGDYLVSSGLLPPAAGVSAPAPAASSSSAP